MSAPATGLRRELGVPGAVIVGLGSIVGTGVFTSLAVAAGVTGPSVVIAVCLAAAVALCNGLSSAQLAASHPVSGGTYEYGHVYLTPALGFSAGWLFLCAKSASAATAALAFASYLSALVGADARRSVAVAIAVGAVAAIAALIVGGLRRTNAVNTAIVSVAIGSLVALVVAGAPVAADRAGVTLAPLWPAGGAPDLLHATALMFVAYTGYGRIATMGEEVHDPERTIPRAIGITLAASAALYAGVAAVAVGVVGADAIAAAVDRNDAPLELVARAVGTGGLSPLLAVGAVAATLGVLLNLILGLSRVVLAMGRRGDMPRATARLDASQSPRVAVLVCAAAVAAIAAIGDIRAAWSLSAVTVLIYYAITNAAALRLPAEARLYPRAVSWLGLASCLGLSAWIEPVYWAVAVAVVAAGFGWRAAVRRLSRPR